MNPAMPKARSDREFSEGGEENALALSPSKPSRQKALCGLFCRKECWSLTLRGKSILFLFVIAFVITLRQGLHPFLAISRDIPGEILVVDGWAPAWTMAQVAAEFQKSSYRQVLVV